MSHPIVPQKTYLLVFICLIGLTLLTTGVAFLNLGPLNTPVALAIAFTKMFLVIYFFMHLKTSSGLVRVTLLAAFFWFVLLVAFIMTDYHTRSWTPTPSSWSTSAPPTHP